MNKIEWNRQQVTGLLKFMFWDALLYWLPVALLTMYFTAKFA